MLYCTKKRLYITSRDTQANEEFIRLAIRQHKADLPVYLSNEALYMSDHDILHAEAKANYKPDNRLVINYAKYIVDTFGGYHLGVPLKISHEDEQVDMFIRDFRRLNDMEDSEYELAKIVDIFGHGFLYVYQDESAQTRVTYSSPLEMMVIHDDTIQERPLFAIRYHEVDGVNGTGELLSDSEIIEFTLTAGEVTITNRYSHVYSKLPVIEMILNDERQGIFESVKTLINALNKAASEKANDVDYFADAYLKVVGTELDEDVANTIRDSRIINLWGDAQTLDAAFLDKPNSDSTQQNLIELLKESIFSVSMVANITEEDFGNASGTALAFKLQAMSNLAKVKDRKMQSALSRLYEVVMSVPMVKVPPDAWQGIIYQFTRNVPRNLLEEAQVVQALDGQVSDETKLKVLSIVDNIKDEMQRVRDQSITQQRVLRQSHNDIDDEVIADGEA